MIIIKRDRSSLARQIEYSMFRHPHTFGGSSTNRRSGYSLPEMLVVMTVTGIVMSVAMTALTNLYQAQATELQVTAEAVLWRRLSNDFRLDVHNARQAASPDGARLELQTAEGPIVWTAADSTLHRTLTSSGSDGSLESTESHRVTDAAIAFEIDASQSSGRPIAAIIFSRAASPGAGPLQRRIEGAVGLSHRFEASPETAPEVSR